MNNNTKLIPLRVQKTFLFIPLFGWGLILWCGIINVIKLKRWIALGVIFAIFIVMTFCSIAISAQIYNNFERPYAQLLFVASTAIIALIWSIPMYLYQKYSFNKLNEESKDD